MPNFARLAREGSYQRARHLEPAAEPGRLVELRDRPAIRAATASSTSSTATRRPTCRSRRRRRPSSDPGTRPRVLRLRDPAVGGPELANNRGGTPWWDAARRRRRRHRGVPHPRQLPGAGVATRRCSRAWAPSTCAAATAPTRCSPIAPSSADDPKGDIQLVSVQDLDLDGTPDTVRGDAARARPTSSTCAPGADARPRRLPDRAASRSSSTPRPTTARGEVGHGSARCCAQGEWSDWIEVELRRAAAAG